MDIHQQSLLPPEIWLHILNIVVQSDDDLRADEHQPLQPPPDLQLGKRAAFIAELACVCRAWYELLLPLLCTNVKLGGEPIPLPHCVKRVILPCALANPKIRYDPAVIVDHLRQCTQVETLCRPAEMDVEAQGAVPPAIPLPSLQRLEWCYSRSMDHLGGIHSLENTLSQCPNLRYLFVTGFTEILLVDEETRVNVPTVETLRLRFHNDSFIHHLLSSRWSLPGLKTVILDTSPTIFRSLHCLFWNKFGRNVTRVELGKHISFSPSDYISACLDGCPALQELGYYPFFITHRVPDRQAHGSLRRIRLHASPNDDLSQSEMWTLLLRHIYRFNYLGMEKLTTFVLHDNWTSFIHDSRWDGVIDSITAEGRELVLNVEHEAAV